MRLTRPTRFGARPPNPGATARAGALARPARLLPEMALALALAAVIAVLAPLYSVAVAPLPLPQPRELVSIGAGGVFNVLTGRVVASDALQSLFTGVAAYWGERAGWLASGRRLRVVEVTKGFFSTLEVKLAAGDGLAAAAPDAGGAVINYKLWRERAQKPLSGALGSIELDGRRYQLVGVAPPGFAFPAGTQVWISGPEGEPGPDPLTTSAVVFGRLRPGVTATKASAGLKIISRRVRAFGLGARPGPDIAPLHQALAGDRRPLLWSVWGACLILLLLACTNIAAVTLARGERQQGEYALRTALGASPARLVSGAVSRAIRPVAGGCVLGLVLGFLARNWAQVAMRRAFGAEPAADTLPTALVAVGAVALAIGAAAMAAALPAWRAAARQPGSGVGPGTGPPRRVLRAQMGLAGAQLALALILLAGAGMALVSAWRRLQYPLGFDARGLAMVQARPPQVPQLAHALQALAAARRFTPAIAAEMQLGSRDEITRDRGLNRAARQALLELPAVAGAASFYPAPFTPAVSPTLTIFLVNPDRVKPTAFPLAQTRYVSGGAFELLGLRLLGGRDFGPEDLERSQQAALAPPYAAGVTARPPVAVVVNAAFALRFWPRRRAVGQTFFAPFPCQVIGEVADARMSARQILPVPTVYQLSPAGDFSLLVRLRPAASFDRFAPAAARALAQLSPAMSPPVVTSLEDRIARASLAWRLLLWLLVGLAVVGLVAAGLGMYAGLEETMAARQREFAIRAALGARASHLYGLAARQAGFILAAALPAAALGAWLLSRGLTHSLYGLSGAPTGAFVVAAVVLAVLVIASSLAAARRVVTATRPAALLAES
ncbi:MAG: ABC transporter permease [Terriglobales bacterium]